MGTSSLLRVTRTSRILNMSSTSSYPRAPAYLHHEMLYHDDKS